MHSKQSMIMGIQRLPRILAPSPLIILGKGWNSFSTSASPQNNSPSRTIAITGRGNDGKKFLFRPPWRNSSTGRSGFRVCEEVRAGVERGDPIVALESAIISHGMPFPDNVNTAFHLQDLVRREGAIPATVGLIGGELTVGLTNDEIESLGSPRTNRQQPLVKVSRRDLPMALSQKWDGGTTVAGTIVGAVKAGIHIFATGGIGGVHRGAETSLDISADLRELGRSQIAVVSAGVKSILDIGKTLEYLETEGVCVVVLKKGNRSNETEMEIEAEGKSGQIGMAKFPSFFTPESQFSAPYSLTDEAGAAHLVNSSINFNLGSGILIAVPIPKWDGRTHRTKIRTAVGGVGRNVAEALAKLGHDPILISPIGDDLFGREVRKQLADSGMDSSKIFTLKKESTAIYSALLNAKGECAFGLGDMDINDKFDGKVFLENCGEVIRNASIVVMDGNLSKDVMTCVLSLCTEYDVPVWFEPTEVRKARKIFQVPRDYWGAVRFISPNRRELMSLAEIRPDVDLSRTIGNNDNDNDTATSDLSQFLQASFAHFPRLEVILLTRGKDGLQIISQKDGTALQTESFPSPSISESEILSVSGAGDCLNAGFISGLLQGLPISDCALKGSSCAKASLLSLHNVPKSF